MSDLHFTSLAAQFPWATLMLAGAMATGAILALSPVARLVGWVDKPGLHKAHEGEVPLIGGWAVLAAMFALQFAGPAELRAPAGYWTGALLLFIVALLDDRWPVRARYRFMVQIVAAVAGISLGGQVLLDVGNLFGEGPVSSWWIVLPVSIVGIVALVNAVNFMDGADGLCGGLGFIGAFWFLFAVSMAEGPMDVPGSGRTAYAASLIPLAATMMGALGGFLLFNLRTPVRRKAAVFLGDSGSMLVGFTLAWLAIHSTMAHGEASVSPVACLWIMAVPMFDSASCIIRRILSGVTPMTADRKHLHDLLRRAGFSVAESVFVVHVGAFVCGLIGVMGWRLGVSDSTGFAAFALTLGTFVVLTNLAWRQIDRRETPIGVAETSTNDGG